MDEVNPSRRWTQRRDSARAQRAELTRQALIAAARELFTEQGFHAVGVRDITARAGVSRGALSHHFADKEALFLAVFEAVEQELIAEAGAALSGTSADPWTQFRTGIQRYLDAAATRADVQRITLVDGPAVLGWARWRKLEEGFSLGALTAVLQSAMDLGRVRQRPVEPLAHLILGSVMEAALLIAHSDEPEQRRYEVGQALDDLLGGLA
ncbi:MAG: transcriptional regulator, TetR family [Phenylobacterium sp.]|nr:transcriptional regulator, TetR family [Phenylobacterium sp.]